MRGGGGGSGSAMVLGKLSVPRRPTNLDNSRAMAYCACSRCGCFFFFFFFLIVFLDIFSLVYLFSFPSDGSIYSEILSQRAVKPKTTNQSNPVVSGMRTPVYMV